MGYDNIPPQMVKLWADELAVRYLIGKFFFQILKILGDYWGKAMVIIVMSIVYTNPL